jgi:DNA mismatch repair protein MutS
MASSTNPGPPVLPASEATPAMRQYFEAKRQYRDAIVFFRMGDFYEMFYEDALVASRALELTLTSRSRDANGGAIPMCGIPYHAADGYIARLVKKGFRVAICEQVEDPRKAKGLVRREVVRVVSPGTLTDSSYLEAGEPAFLMAVLPASASGARSDRTPRATAVGAALLDLSTGEFVTAEYDGEDGVSALADEISVLRPREVLAPEGADIGGLLPLLRRLSISTTFADEWTFEPEAARSTLLEQLQTRSLEGFGLEHHPAAVRAAGALVRYLRDTQKVDLAHVRAVAFKEAADRLVIDPVTLRHLGVVESPDGSRTDTLLHQVDRSVTAMGARLLRSWLLRPLVHLEPIRDRLDAVEDLAFRTTDRGRFRETLKVVQDLERLVARAALGTAGPKELVALKQSIAAVPRIRLLLEPFKAPLIESLAGELDDVEEVRDAIDRTLVDDPPALARDGGFTRDGVDPELDDLRGISRSGRQVISRMEEEERSRTGIGSLKIRYNRVFGYYIEVSKSNLHAVPADYHRKQTIAGGERYITPALKEYEAKVLGADERILERESEIFERLRAQVGSAAPRIQQTARALAALDVLAALAETATLCNYTKPQMHEGDEIVILDGRHPVVERNTAEPFVPNDVMLDGADRQLVILTGPNMGGKSTYLRQAPLVCLLAQAGSFVPAREAKLAIVDRLFARVGASDNIARGQSTFMVEMQETANILHSATPRSLVILDEIGRGTATFDGLSIAWAVAEHLATCRARPRTLFATHYHELTELADTLPGVVNLHVAAREWNDDIVFLRKVVPGRSDRSYGIQVARLAGLPRSVTTRAREILDGLERDALTRGGRPPVGGRAAASVEQLPLFQAPSAADRLAKRLRETDVERTTPLDALALLVQLKKEFES